MAAMALEEEITCQHYRGGPISNRAHQCSGKSRAHREVHQTASFMLALPFLILSLSRCASGGVPFATLVTSIL